MYIGISVTIRPGLAGAEAAVVRSTEQQPSKERMKVLHPSLIPRHPQPMIIESKY